MGVPSFFVWLTKTFCNKNFIKTNVSNPKYLFIDANCLIHPICFLVLHQFNTLAKENGKIISTEELEKNMMDEIVNYIVAMITSIESQHVYIAVDGVAPMAKILQQRKRRYKAYIENITRNEIKKKYDMLSAIDWSNMKITPGTPFMEKLHERLTELSKMTFLKTKTIIYSSYLECGEGEHKILQFIKKHKLNWQNEIDNNLLLDPIIIYGLDADLIFLALSSNCDNIYLMREKDQIKELESPTIDKSYNGNKQSEFLNKFNFVYLQSIIQDFYDKIASKCQDKFDSLTIQNVKNDFIFLCFFVGNDFIPSIPSICIKNRGLDQIINSYIECLIETQINLIQNGKINQIFLQQLFNKLAVDEIENYISIIENNKKKRNYVYNSKLSSKENAFQKEIWDYENNINVRQLQAIHVISEYRNCDAFVKNNFYDKFAGINEYYDESIEKLVGKYLEGLKWNFEYYFNSCPSHMWYYPHHIAPFFSDICKYLMIRDCNDINKFVFSNNETKLHPFEQLMLAIPKQYHDMLNVDLRKCIDYDGKHLSAFYDNLYFDVTKNVLWKSIPLMLPLQIDTIQTIYSQYISNESKLKSTESTKSTKIENIN